MDNLQRSLLEEIFTKGKLSSLYFKLLFPVMLNDVILHWFIHFLGVSLGNYLCIFYIFAVFTSSGSRSLRHCGHGTFTLHQ